MELKRKRNNTADCVLLVHSNHSKFYSYDKQHCLDKPSQDSTNMYSVSLSNQGWSADMSGDTLSGPGLWVGVAACVRVRSGLSRDVGSQHLWSCLDRLSLTVQLALHNSLHHWEEAPSWQMSSFQQLNSRGPYCEYAFRAHVPQGLVLSRVMLRYGLS